MIPIKLQLVLVLICLFILAVFVLKVRAYKLELKYVVLWIITILVSLVLAIFPSLLLFIAKFISIEVPANALFLFAQIACFLILYSLTVALSGSSTKIKNLTQELALLKEEVEQLKSHNRKIV